MRPLYLDPGTDWRVALDDGPSLRLSADGRARSLFPIARLSRVVSPLRACWDSTALLACLKSGVPVLFADPRGETVGWCFGNRKRESTITGLLRIAVDEPDGEVWINDWQRAIMQKEIIATLRALGVRNPAKASCTDASAARSRLCNWHRHRLGQPVVPWLKVLERCTAAIVAEELAESIGSPELIAYPVPGLHLGIVFSDLLEWRSHRILAELQPQDLEKDPLRWAAAEAERQGTMLRSGIRTLLHSLETMLRRRVG